MDSFSLLLLHAARVYLLGISARELSTIWLPRQDLNDDTISPCASMDGGTLTKSLDEELEAVNDCQRGKISVLQG